MVQINLRNLFPEYTVDCFVEVLDENVEAFKKAITKEIADVFLRQQRQENAYERRKRFHNANQSVDYTDEVMDKTTDPLEILLDKFAKEKLQEALDTLSQKQRERIYSHYILGLSKAEIARSEGLAENAVKDSIQRGLKNIKKYLKNFF